MGISDLQIARLRYGCIGSADSQIEIRGCIGSADSQIEVRGCIGSANSQIENHRVSDLQGQLEVKLPTYSHNRATTARLRLGNIRQGIFLRR